MRQFFKFLLASTLGVFVAGTLMAIFGIIIIAQIANEENKGNVVKENTILHITLDEAIPELTEDRKSTRLNSSQIGRASCRERV